MKKESLMINGGTLIKIEAGDRFVYIEDDFLDEKGKPILIEYPSRLWEISQEDAGKRLLVLYDGDFNFQLVRLNDELEGLIPDCSPFYPLTGNLSEYSCVPHPNMENVEKNGHELSGSEKEEFADLYVKVVQSIVSRFVKVSIITISVITIIFSATIEGEYPLKKIIPIGIAVWIGLVLFIFIGILLGKGNLRRQGRKLIYVKEVVFHSYIIENNTIKIKVYEWNEEQIHLCEYPAVNVAADTVYGNVLYKFTNQKGNYVLLNKEPVGKKRK